MEMFYVSHPYSGNEEWNKNDAREIIKDLQRTHPNIIFINPLDVFQVAKMDKAVIMQMCVELMLKCDGVIFTGTWKSSEGCRLEYFMADETEQSIFIGVNDFKMWYMQTHDSEKWKKNIWIEE